MERNWTDKQYHIQDNDAIELKYVKMYCNKNQFPEFLFSGPHSKPHDARGLSKHYHLRFDPKLGMGVCAIHRMCLCCLYINARQTLDIWYITRKKRAL